MFERKINKNFTLKDIQHLSSYEIFDIIGNYKKEDFCIERKYYRNLNLLNDLTLL